ncbi:MAG: sulfotransferase domain-containing protein [Pseudomonadota bacterium]
MPRKPNLFVIGAMKSGTSSLCQYLAEHPAIFMSPVKEPMHFSREENWSQGNEHYLKLFVKAKDELYIAEGSTEYTKRPFREGVAQRLHEFNSSSRLVYIMRDPFDRLVSQFRHQVRMGRESGSLCEALQRPSDYLTNSYYAYQLKPYLKLFGSNAVYTDTFESLAVSPNRFIKRLYRWLKIDDTFVPASMAQRFHVSPSVVQVFDEHSLRVRISKYLKQFSIVDRFTPPIFRKWYKALAPKNVVLNVKSAEFRLEVDKARQILQPILYEWVEELREITGNSYEMWPAVNTSLESIDLANAEPTFWLPEEIRTL